jgi:holo-[acyl-carrier protein] synthase
MRIGVDLVEVARIARLIKNKNFLERVFTARETAYCLPKKNKAQHFAVRFATKEAVWKALGTGTVALKDIGVTNRVDGRPRVTIKGRARADIDISLSHTDAYAVAVAIITGKGARAHAATRAAGSVYPFTASRQKTRKP